MTTKLLVENKHGLHLRAVARLVRIASDFDCTIAVKNHGQAANAKSLLNLLALAVPEGAEVEVVAEGSDAELALQAISRLARARFGDPE